jgi:predicted site-specific integrase-resolvase
MTYVKSKEAQKRLGVTAITLREWASSGKINYIRVKEGGNRLYDVEKFISDRVEEEPEVKTEKISYIYCRVSSHSQKEDLERQIKYLKERYPDHKIAKDIASGINFKRKGLNNILVNAMQGLVKEVVVAHRDRLCRIAYEHFEWLFKQYGVNIIVEDKQEYSPESEFSEDLFSIIHVFSARHYGLRRKYTSKEVTKDSVKNSENAGDNVTQKTRKNKSKS